MDTLMIIGVGLLVVGCVAYVVYDFYQDYKWNKKYRDLRDKNKKKD